jgi:Na+-driven multidrug efflux pump
VKSLIVRYVCDGGSGRDFKVAASVTGYAYVANLIVGLFGILVLWFLVPPITINVSKVEALSQAVADYKAARLASSGLYVAHFISGLLLKSYL